MFKESPVPFILGATVEYFKRAFENSICMFAVYTKYAYDDVEDDDLAPVQNSKVCDVRILTM